MTTSEFIETHKGDDVRKLAFLSGRYPEVDMAFALNQIAGYQTAQAKLPTWAATEGIIFPPHINMEQCSSELTARYKANVLARYVGASPSSYMDMTGGFGVDFSFMARGFKEAVYVERNAELCQIAKHNLELLQLDNFTAINGNGEEELHRVEHIDAIFLDPARRDSNGGKVVALSDCAPDVIALKEELFHKADTIMLKLSPMLDWHKAISDIGEEHTREVHIVSVGNECKELLLIHSATATNEPIRIVCADLSATGEQTFSYFIDDDSTSAIAGEEESEMASFLYEPNAATMKAGCFNQLSATYGAKQVAMNSHLFVSKEEIKDFPGRRFRVVALSSLNKRELKLSLSGIEKANITVRNFPMKVDVLRKKLKLKDGGSVFIFATTLSDNSHRLFICEKA